MKKIFSYIMVVSFLFVTPAFAKEGAAGVAARRLPKAEAKLKVLQAELDADNFDTRTQKEKCIEMIEAVKRAIKRYKKRMK